MQRGGLRITGPMVEFTVPVRALVPEEVNGKVEQVLLCVKSQDTVAAVESLRSLLSETGYIVSFQNGLNEPVIADLVEARRTIGAFVNFGADYLGPGLVHYGGPGALVVGELDGAITSRLQALQQVLFVFDPGAALSNNIYGYLWSKQAYAALLKASALTNAPIADVLEAPVYRQMLAELVREVVRGAAANSVRLEAFDAFDPSAFAGGAPVDAVRQCFDAMIAYNRHSAKTHSGIWRDLAVRKRRTEVAAQLAPVIKLAGERGVEMPLVVRLRDLIEKIEDGVCKQGWEALDVLRETFAISRPVVVDRSESA